MKCKSNSQLWLLQTQGPFLRLEVASLERLTFFKLPGTEWPRARLFKGQPSPAVFGGLPPTRAYSQPLSAATAAGQPTSSTVSLSQGGEEARARDRGKIRSGPPPPPSGGGGGQQSELSPMADFASKSHLRIKPLSQFPRTRRSFLFPF